jgi:cobalt/nickel transport system permease protein
MEYAHDAERLAQRGGVLQRLDPRVKVVGALVLIGTTLLAHHLPTLLGVWTVAIVLARLSQIPWGTLQGVGTSVLLFTGPIALPALFIVPGEVIYQVPLLGWPVTGQGVTSATLLFGRALTATTLATLAVLSTPWPHLLKALRVLGVPAVVTIILGMTHRYIFLLLQTAHALFEARQSRLVGTLKGAEHRRLVAATAGVLLSKSLHLADEVFLAMQSRGYRGEHFTLTHFRMRPGDWAALGVAVTVAATALWFDA